MHPIVALYCAKECPSQDVVLEMLSAAETITTEQQASVVVLATIARHRAVVFDLLAKSSPGSSRGALLAAGFGSRYSTWLHATEGWFEHLDHAVPNWPVELLTPDEGGLSGWDRLLLDCLRVDMSCPNQNTQSMPARVAQVLQQRCPDAFHQPHPAMPAVSCAQVWAWLWSSIPMRNTHLAHWGYLLSCDIDPNFVMDVEGGKMSMGTALLWAVRADAMLPHPVWCKTTPPIEPSIYAAATWMVDTEIEGPHSSEFSWHALWMLRQAGMAPATLVEPTVWSTPALGLLARRDRPEGGWSTEYFQQVKDRWLGLGLDMGLSSDHGRTLLDIASAQTGDCQEVSEPLSPLGYCIIDQSLWRRASTPDALDRFWNSTASLGLFDAEPGLKRALLERIVAEFDQWSGGPSDPAPSDHIKQLAECLPALAAAQPLSALGAIVMEHLRAQPFEAVLQKAAQCAVAKAKIDVALQTVPSVSERAQLLLLANGRSSFSGKHSELAKVILKWARSESSQSGAAPSFSHDLLDAIPGTSSRPAQLLLSRLMTSLDTWASPDHLGEAELDEFVRLQELSEAVVCADVLPADESALLEYFQSCTIHDLLSATLCLAARKTKDPQKRLDLDRLGLHHRTRPSSVDLSARMTTAVAAWGRQEFPCAPPDAAHRDAATILAVKKSEPEDAREVVVIYSEKALSEFGEWSASRVEADIVRSWRERLVSPLPTQKPKLDDPKVQRQRTRRLALATPALDALVELRAGFPHFEDVIGQLQDHLSLATRGDGGFAMPPLLLAGPPGTGKTFFFQEMASKVATSYRLLNMESITAGFAIVGMDQGWSGASPGVVFETMMADNATANPIILLDEIDKMTTVSNAPVGPVLLSLLESHSARRFTDRCIPLEMDVSRINWVATANVLDHVDLPLRSRFNIVHVANPDYYARRAMSQHIYRALRLSHSWGASFDAALQEETLQVLARPANAARDLRKNIHAALATAARANRSQLLPQDIPVNTMPPPLAPWDAPLPELAPTLSNASIGAPA